MNAGKHRTRGSDGRVTRGREEGKAVSDPSDLMGAPGPLSLNRRVISGQHVPGVATPGLSSPVNSVRHYLYLATWNVLSLQSSSSKLFELARAVSDFRLGILLLTETHWPGVETMTLENGALFINSGRLDIQIQIHLTFIFRFGAKILLILIC